MTEDGASRTRSTSGAGRLLELVRSKRATTKLELARSTGLARATVNDRLTLLLESALIQVASPLRSTGGRPPSSYAFNEQAGVVLVADMGASSVRFACCDLGARVLTETRDTVDLDAGPTVLLDSIRRGLADVLDSSAMRSQDVMGVTIGVPGPVDFSRGQVVSPPIMTGWDRLDIRRALELPYAGPVLIENDANLMALGEHRAHLRDHDNVIFVKVGTGVGCGIIVFGVLYRGSVGGAGDIGHVRGPGLDAVCRCGNRGCVETAAGGWGLARDLRAQGLAVESTADVTQLLRKRDPAAVELAARAGRVLGAAIADAVSLLTPSAVILGGEVALADERMLSAVREVVYARSHPLATGNLRIEASQLGEQAGVVGGAHLALEHVFAPQTVDRTLETGVL